MILLTQLAPLVAMEKKAGLLQAYKNWAAAKTIWYFTKAQPYNPHDAPPLEQCRFIPLSELHADLDRKVANHFLVNYVVVPIVGITAITVATGFVVYKNS